MESLWDGVECILDIQDGVNKLCHDPMFWTEHPLGERTFWLGVLKSVEITKFCRIHPKA